MALDGTLFNLPDTLANEQAFGRSRNRYGKGAYAQARVVLLPDGSYPAQLVPNAQAAYPMQRPQWVRIIEYALTDERLGEPGQVYRLVTTWLNPRSAGEADLDPDRVSFTEAMFQICEALADERGDVPLTVQQGRAGRLRQRLRRRLLPPRSLRINRRELKQVYRKYKPKKRDVAPPRPFEPGERFAGFVLVMVRPQGSKLLAEVTPLGLK